MRGYNYVASVALHVAFIALISSFRHEITPEQGKEAQITEIEIEFISNKLSISKSIPEEKRKSITKSSEEMQKVSNKKEDEDITVKKPANSTPASKAITKNNDSNVKKEEHMTTNSMNTPAINESKNNTTILRGVNTKPACKRCIKPKYPRTALRRNQQGYVLVELSVNTKGRVTKTIILKSSGINSIDNAVLKVARQSIFIKQKENTNFTVAYELKISK